MTCETVRLPGGTTAIVCGRGGRRPRCRMPGCTRPGDRQCDFPLLAGGTCDKYLCARHAVRLGPDRDHCPDHPAPRR